MYDARGHCLRHLQFAWWSLLCFVVLGMALEILHAFKIRWYIDSTSELRRLMWTLAHAHGTFLALVHAAFAFSCYVVPHRKNRAFRLASALLMVASALLPGGFFLGGLFVLENDPGIGVWLVPLGAAALMVAIFLTAVDVLRAGPVAPAPSKLGDSEPPNSNLTPSEIDSSFRELR